MHDTVARHDSASPTAALGTIIAQNKHEKFARTPDSADARFRQLIGKPGKFSVAYTVMGRLFKCVFMRYGGGHVTFKFLAEDLGINLHNVYKYVRLLRDSGVMNLLMERGRVIIRYPNPMYTPPAATPQIKKQLPVRDDEVYQDQPEYNRAAHETKEMR